MKNFTNGMVRLVKTPTNNKKNKLFVRIEINGESLFVPHGSIITEEWMEISGIKKNKETKIMANGNNKGNLWEAVGKIWEHSALINGNGSFDHFLEFKNIDTGEMRYGGTTVGSMMWDYWEVSKRRAMLQPW